MVAEPRASVQRCDFVLLVRGTQLKSQGRGPTELPCDSPVEVRPLHTRYSSKGTGCFAAWLKGVCSQEVPQRLSSQEAAVPLGRWRRSLCSFDCVEGTANNTVDFSIRFYDMCERACVLWNNMGKLLNTGVLLKSPSSWNNLGFNRTVTKKNLKNSYIQSLPYGLLMSAPFLYFIFPVLELKPRAVHMLGKCSTRELYLLVLSPFFHFSFQLAYRVADFLMTFSCIFSFGCSPSPVVSLSTWTLQFPEFSLHITRVLLPSPQLFLKDPFWPFMGPFLRFLPSAYTNIHLHTYTHTHLNPHIHM